jgi:hypothetical protein
MCYICAEAAAAGVAVLVGWRLWLYRVINIPSKLNRALHFIQKLW